MALYLSSHGHDTEALVVNSVDISYGMQTISLITTPDSRFPSVHVDKPHEDTDSYFAAFRLAERLMADSAISHEHLVTILEAEGFVGLEIKAGYGKSVIAIVSQANSESHEVHTEIHGAYTWESAVIPDAMSVDAWMTRALDEVVKAASDKE